MHMRNLFLPVSLMFLFQCCSSQANRFPKMFRDNVTHDSYLATSYGGVYDTIVEK
jgi:hypothetical protein